MALEQNSSLVAILDDDESIRDALLDLVESERLPALCFNSAEEFLDSRAGREASCLIADIRMPGMSGLELQATLKSESCFVPIIFITGLGDVPMAVRAMREGAIDFLTKPVDDAALLKSVARAFHQYRENRREAIEYEMAEAQRLSQTGSWAWNPATGENTYGSEECLRVLGFDPAGPIPRFEQFFQRIHPDDQAASREWFEKAIRDKADFEFGYRIVHPDKGVRNIHVVGHAVLDRSGEIGEFIGTSIDVTERKRAEQELQQLVDFVPQLIVVFDSDGKEIHANRVFREYT